MVPVDWAEYDSVEFVAMRVEEIEALDFEEDTFVELMLELRLCVTDDGDADVVWVVTTVMTDDGAVTVTVVARVHGQFVIVVGLATTVVDPEIIIVSPPAQVMLLG